LPVIQVYALKKRCRPGGCHELPKGLSGFRPAKPLAGIPYFAGLADAVLDDIERKIRRRQYAAGEVILMEGDRGDRGLFLVLEGMVKVCKISPEGASRCCG